LASFCASTLSSVADKILLACASVASAPRTVVLFTILLSAACCWFNCACCWANACRNAKSSTFANICPGLTRSPTLTSTSLSWAPFGKPRFWEVTAASAPEALILVATEPRCTRMTGAGAGVDEQAASVAENIMIDTAEAIRPRAPNMIIVRLINSHLPSTSVDTCGSGARARLLPQLRSLRPRA
jgi:hypothetical protein